MLQHLLFLRPSIEGVSVTTENLAFKIVYGVTTPILFAFAVIFYTRICFTDAINCITNSTDSFKVLRAIDSHCLENAFVDVGKDQLYLHNYQYVGLFFIVCGIIVYLPYVGWEWCENGLMKNMLQDLMSLTLDKGTMAAQLQKVVKIWSESREVFSSYAASTIFCECLNLSAIATVFVLGNEMLLGHFYTLGLRGQNENPIFSKVANCVLDTNSLLPSQPIRYEGICTMNLNYLSQKLFYWTWWWMLVVMTIIVGNLTYRYAMVRHVDLRTARITSGASWLCSSTSPKKESLETQDAFLKGLTYGEWFVLGRIQANVPPSTFDHLIRLLSKQAKVETDE